jgi:fructoselysine-6-phosphate deglycase
MFNFDRERYIKIQTGAVSMAGEIDKTIGDLISGGAKNLFFLGTGGAGILMLPAVHLLKSQSNFPVFISDPAELVLQGDVHLGFDSIVVMPSLSGKTKESIAAMEYAQARGAKVIIFTGYADRPLAEKADFLFVNFGEDDTSSESFYLQSLLVAASIMKSQGEFPGYEQLIREVIRLPSLLVDVKAAFENKAEKMAQVIADNDYHIITSSGNTWAEAFYYGMCILEEMQWIRTRPIHGSDFFHGTLELLDNNVSIIILKGEDATRLIMDRVEKFANEYSKIVNVIDTKTFDLPGISQETRALISPALLSAVLERVSVHLEFKRKHPLTTRRYYNQFEY